jgi:1,4-dihydroxy-2-naphthoate octaprenyltransferase
MNKRIKKSLILAAVFLFIGSGFIFLSIDYKTVQSAINGLIVSMLCFISAGGIFFVGNIKNLINDDNAR